MGPAAQTKVGIPPADTGQDQRLSPHHQHVLRGMGGGESESYTGSIHVVEGDHARTKDNNLLGKLHSDAVLLRTRRGVGGEVEQTDISSYSSAGVDGEAEHTHISSYSSAGVGGEAERASMALAPAFGLQWLRSKPSW